MGNRTEGRTKRKSVKANVTSKFSAKRKLSRMGKKVKKGKAGPSTEFITRSAALRKLQITLKDFRRLCILKGVYPRVPVKPLQGAEKVYYDIKDISYIMHEPLLEKFREFKSFMKKIRRAAGRNQFSDARRRNELKPKITLDHLVRERYPRFVDALRDLDDCLCMIHLFAALPSIGRITAEKTNNCSKLAREWQYFVSKSRSLRKVFISVKGVYCQVELLGEQITWLQPHSFTQHLPKEVDFRVMLTFLDFYEVFLQFVLFKLYALRGWQYPPKVDTVLDASGSCLLAMHSGSDVVKDAGSQSQQQLEQGNAAVKTSIKAATITDAKLNKQLSTLPQLLETIATRNNDGENEKEDDEDEEGDISQPLTAAFSDLQQSAAADTNDQDEQDQQAVFHRDEEQQEARTSIFRQLVFFINREVPLQLLQLCITSFGGRVAWDGPGSPIDVNDPSITHHIIDRPIQGTHTASAQREYIQPQWVFDSINAGLLLPIRLYAPAVKLPPHLSPFVADDARDGYMPRYREEVRQLQIQAGVVKEDELKPVVKSAKIVKSAEPESDNDEDDDMEVDVEADEDNEDDEDEDEESEEEDEEELAEIPPPKSKKTAPVDTKKGPKAIVHQSTPAFSNETNELHQLAVNMMSKKTKRLYEKMQYGINQKTEAVELLEKKRKAIEEKEDPVKETKQSGNKKEASKQVKKPRKTQ